MTAVATALARDQYELAALRLLLGVLAAIDRIERSAPGAREELVHLLMPESQR